MAKATITGPTGALLALGNLVTTLHGVSVRHHASGKTDHNGHDTTRAAFYVDGKRSNRTEALARLSAHIAPGAVLILEGPLQ